jgi:demethylmenaquinone methyltransferase/2-methoxy-6-polyprenyl-1,4-benzoquinol methylase
MTRADLDKKPAQVRAMFDDVAPRYDLTNDVLSLGQDRRWRRDVLNAVDPQPGERVLDLAAGTGTSSLPFRDRGAMVVPCDFSVGMLQVGKRNLPQLPFTAGDGTQLPFADDTFDAVTISFGLRNIVDPDAGLREMLRVTRPGGRLVVCEFSSPTWSPFRTVYIEYLMKALPSIARAVASSPDAYVYLAESIRAWPDQQGLAARVEAAGWSNPEWRNLTGGIVAMHRATATK